MQKYLKKRKLIKAYEESIIVYNESGLYIIKKRKLKHNF